MAISTDTKLSGAELRKWREAAGLSRRALAEAAGCSASWIEVLELAAPGALPRRSFVPPAIIAALEVALTAKDAPSILAALKGDLDPTEIEAIEAALDRDGTA